MWVPSIYPHTEATSHELRLPTPVLKTAYMRNEDKCAYAKIKLGSSDAIIGVYSLNALTHLYPETNCCKHFNSFFSVFRICCDGGVCSGHVFPVPCIQTGADGDDDYHHLHRHPQPRGRQGRRILTPTQSS